MPGSAHSSRLFSNGRPCRCLARYLTQLGLERRHRVKTLHDMLNEPDNDKAEAVQWSHRARKCATAALTSVKQPSSARCYYREGILNPLPSVKPMKSHVTTLLCIVLSALAPEKSHEQKDQHQDYHAKNISCAHGSPHANKKPQ